MAPQREWFEKDYYKVLGVPANSTDKEITQAYRKLAKKYHPDAHPGSEDRFKEISAAYDVLGDATRRKEYDEVRRLGPVGGGFGRGGFGTAQGAPGAGGATFRMEDLGDLFGGIFSGRQGRRGARGPQRGADAEAELNLSFADAIHGVTTSVNVPEDVRCTTCKGSGAAPGTASHTCPRCGGKGTVDENQGLFSLPTVCTLCNGRGTVVDTPCPTCGGTGTEQRLRSVKVRIPAGVDQGQRIRVKGRGAPGQGMAPAGDLYVVVHVAPDQRFSRRGRNLTVAVPVTFPDATLGTTVTVPTLDGALTVKVPAGTASGTYLRVKGHGVPAGPGKGGAKHGPGDLLVRVDVLVPKTLTDDQRQAVEHLASALGSTSHQEAQA